MSKRIYTILIAEDDLRTRTALTHSLEAAGYKVIAAADGQIALDYFQDSANDIDLVVLDVLMPHLDGFQVCQTIRETSDVPIIMATVLGSSTDRIIGLEMGANDYIVKPFAITELIARIRSILRRWRSLPRESHRRPDKPEPAPPPSQNLVQIGQLSLDPTARKAYLGSHRLRLTEIEFRLLELLANKPGTIFSRGEILEALWGYDASSAADTKTVDVHISRLRIKLNDHTRNPDFIVTIRGRGYMFLTQR